MLILTGCRAIQFQTRDLVNLYAFNSSARNQAAPASNLRDGLFRVSN